VESTATLAGSSQLGQRNRSMASRAYCGRFSRPAGSNLGRLTFDDVQFHVSFSGARRHQIVHYCAGDALVTRVSLDGSQSALRTQGPNSAPIPCRLPSHGTYFNHGLICLNPQGALQNALISALAPNANIVATRWTNF
jgi:hypothetical protein